MHIAIAKAKNYDEAAPFVENEWTGEEEFAAIVRAIESRDGRSPRRIELEDPAAVQPAPVVETVSADSEAENKSKVETGVDAPMKTPQCSHTPDPDLLRAPLGPANEAHIHVPAFVAGRDVPTPTPIPTATAAEAVSSQ